jgi:hypothetical protein
MGLFISGETTQGFHAIGLRALRMAALACAAVTAVRSRVRA